jgi:hypothetical protein
MLHGLTCETLSKAIYIKKSLAQFMCRYLYEMRWEPEPQSRVIYIRTSGYDNDITPGMAIRFIWTRRRTELLR